MDLLQHVVREFWQYAESYGGRTYADGVIKGCLRDHADQMAKELRELLDELSNVRASLS
jgi:hypothetical protein